MDSHLYYISKDEFPLLRKLKEEANIILTNCFNKYGSNSVEFIRDRSQLDRIINILKELSPYGLSNNDFIINSLEDFITFIKTGILSPLTLSDSEFRFSDEDEVAKYYINNRYDHIERYDTSGLGIDQKYYINTKAFIPIVKAHYHHNNKLQYIHENYINFINPRLWITKGGVITGEYIYKFYIDINDEDFSYLINPIKLPVSIIDINSDYLYTVDNREPKLHELLSLYNVTKFTDDSKKGKYDIRKYTKLNNK